MGGHEAPLLIRRVKSQTNHTSEGAHQLSSARDTGPPNLRIHRKSSLTCRTRQEQESRCNETFHHKSRSCGEYTSRRHLSAPGQDFEAAPAGAVAHELGKLDVEDGQSAADAWADVAEQHAEGAACQSSHADLQALILSRQAQAIADEACALQKLVDCLQHMQSSVTDDVEVLCRGIATHCAGAAAASSLSELQDHLSELVQLSGPEVSCAWSTVKVGLGVASVLSGNLMIGSCMVALAVGSLGTSIIWKVHRDNQRSTSSSKGKHSEALLEAWGSAFADSVEEDAFSSRENYASVPSEHQEGQSGHVHLEKNVNDSSKCEGAVDCDAWSELQQQRPCRQFDISENAHDARLLMR
ncbi:hypothetical protein Esti_001088 [Eimeria stiedai]